MIQGRVPLRRVLPGFAAILIAWAFSLWAYPHLPARVATHWGVGGAPDGWSSREFLVFVVPGIGVLLGLLLAFLPLIDPRRKEATRNAPTYGTLVSAALLLLAAIQGIMVAYNLGWPIRIPTLVPVGVGILFAVIGNLMPRMQPNWFMGIRTPWTLSSDRVWRQTHRLGGYCFMILGAVLVVVGVFAPPASTLWVVGGIVAAALIPVVYSYFAWRRERESATTGTRATGRTE